MNPINIPIETKTVTLTKEQFEFLNWTLYYGPAVSNDWFPVKKTPTNEKIKWANSLFNYGFMDLYNDLRKITPIDPISITLPTFYIPFITALLVGIEDIQEILIENDLSIEYTNKASKEFISEKSKRVKSSEFVKAIGDIFNKDLRK